MAYIPVDQTGYKAWIKEYSRIYEAPIALDSIGQAGNSFREGSIMVFDGASGVWRPGDPTATSDAYVGVTAPIGFVYPGYVAYTASNYNNVTVPVISKDIFESKSVKIVLPPCILSLQLDNVYFEDPSVISPGTTLYLYMAQKQYVLNGAAPPSGNSSRVVGTVTKIDGNYAEVFVDSGIYIVSP